MEKRDTLLEDAFLLIPRIFRDDRGYFIESFNRDSFRSLVGKEILFVQDNESLSVKGTLRGFHYQKPPYAQAKLVRVVQGAVQDVIVDLRAHSPSYGKAQSFILSGDNKHQLFIPRGFAHAFLTLSDTAIFSYKVDNSYHPESDSGIIWNDPQLAIAWELDEDNLLLSKKDASLKSFEDYKKYPDFS